jgi:predicted methyltransferase
MRPLRKRSWLLLQDEIVSYSLITLPLMRYSAIRPKSANETHVLGWTLNRRYSVLKRMLPLLIITSLSSGMAFADSFSDKIKTAMASEHRTDKEKMRDNNRAPVETLAFFGIKEDMKVVELMPGRGWYSKLLASALKDKGQLYVGIYTKHIKKMMNDNPLLKGIKLIAEKSELKWDKASKLYNVVNPELNVTDIDAVLTFRNYHNFNFEGRMTMNKEAYAALKPGGIYGVVDHTRRHMAEFTGESRRRIDPVLAIKEIQSAGFEFVDYTNLHYRPDDELRYEVGRKTVTGNTDRFTLLFKKPM